VVTSASELTVQTFEIAKEETIAAPIEIVFETMLEQLGPLFEPADRFLRSTQLLITAGDRSDFCTDLGAARPAKRLERLLRIGNLDQFVRANPGNLACDERRRGAVADRVGDEIMTIAFDFERHEQIAGL